MKKYINLVLMFAGFDLMIGCGSKNKNSSPPISGGTCSTIPAGVALSGQSCTTTSGKWTAYDIIETSASRYYTMYCNDEEYDHDSSQANFDENEGTSVSPSVKITSNEDYVSTAICVSGSIYYDDGTSKHKHTFIWTKQP